LTSEEACQRLGVKRQTLYAYVSRGWIRTVPSASGRKLYAADDVERIAERARGPRPALRRWEDPIMETAISAVDDRDIWVRGRSLMGWIREGNGFEETWALLRGRAARPFPSVTRTVPVGGTPVRRMIRWAASRPHDGDGPSEIMAALAKCTGARGEGRLAHRLVRGWGRPEPADRERTVDIALTACAEHELSVSTFAARVAASAGSSIVSAIGAALFAFTGPRHGAACSRIDRFWGTGTWRELERRLQRRHREHQPIPGFDHPMHPSGDPRVPVILDRLTLPEPAPQWLDWMAERGHRPTVDFALVALTRSLDLEDPGGAASGLFALGRAAGWIAHIEEQRETPGLLRPRARYVGSRDAGPVVGPE
jgi:citrate synthase